MCEAQCSVLRNEHLYCRFFFFCLLSHSFLQGWTLNACAASNRHRQSHRSAKHKRVFFSPILFWNICSRLKLFLSAPLFFLLLHDTVKASGGGQGMFLSPNDICFGCQSNHFDMSKPHHGRMHRSCYMFKRCTVDGCAGTWSRSARGQHETCLMHSMADFEHWFPIMAIITYTSSLLNLTRQRHD